VIFRVLTNFRVLSELGIFLLLLGCRLVLFVAILKGSLYDVASYFG
jgi:hypothetical protein